MQLTAKQFFLEPEALRDPAVESAYISGLKMRNGTFKQTSPSRFASLEAPLATALAPDADQIREVLDVGMSMGQTTVELADFLGTLGIPAELTGTDLFIDAHLIDVGTNLHVLTDAGGWPLQYGYYGRAFRPWSSRLDYLTLAAVPRALAQKMLRKTLLRKIESADTRLVQMVGQALRDRKITLVENDIFTPTDSFATRFDFIRAANILNKGYFAPDQIRKAISNIKAYSSGPGAFLLVVRTTGTENDGTLFKLSRAGGYDAVKRFGKGSEIENLVLTHHEFCKGD